jgi:hypothetical protein
MEEHYLRPGAWIDVLARQYIKTYLPQGGSSVKVVVADANDRAQARDALEQLAKLNNMAYANLDAATTKAHMIHQLFNAIAAQIDWKHLANMFMRGALKEHYGLPGSGSLSVEAIAEANNESSDLVRKELRRIIDQRVFRDYELSREFRFAATALCRSVYDPSDDIQQEAESVCSWLTGRLNRIGALRRIFIYRKIGRNNARQILYSTAAWLRSAGMNGLVVTVDISRYALGRAAEGTGETYTKFAATDMHEVLRQFVDGTDHLKSTLFVFMTNESFLSDFKLGIRNYEALRLRLTDEVRDRNRPNPFAPMVRLRESAA